MRDRSAGRGSEPPAAGDTARPERESRDSTTGRLGRLPARHPSSPRYREATPLSGSRDGAGAPGNADPGAAPGRRRWPFSGRARDSQAPSGDRGAGSRGPGAAWAAERPGQADAARGAQRRRPARRASRDPDGRAERLAAWRGGDGSAPPLGRRSAPGSGDRTRGEGSQRRDGQRDQSGYAAWRAHSDKRRRNQRGQGDQSAAGGGPQSRGPAYRPWFASGAEGPPWFAEGSGDAFEP